MSPEKLLKALRDAVYKKMPCPLIQIHDMKNFTIRYNINPVQYYNQLLMQPDKKYERKQLKLVKPTSQ
tara:strand:+ start:10652 stop:10855 length:204 start_codon:yes stop_codon:yes gene_type:complete